MEKKAGRHYKAFVINVVMKDWEFSDDWKGCSSMARTDRSINKGQVEEEISSDFD